MWKKLFKSQDYNMPTYKHKSLPVYQTIEFDFFRCVQFNDCLYNKTVSELHKGNLRECNGRYSKLFPNQKISYWADSPKTARAEVKSHGANNNLLTFWAYDDTSSTFPTVEDLEMLTIIDGRQCGIQEIIDKIDIGEDISSQDKKLIDDILACNPDCLAFDSHANEGGENFIFLEKGFKKLSLRRVRLRLGSEKGKGYKDITCAFGSDYSPFIEAYGEYFVPKLQVKKDDSYRLTDEYQKRNEVRESFYDLMRKEKRK